MMYQLLVVAACAAIVAHGNLTPELEAARERLEKYVESEHYMRSEATTEERQIWNKLFGYECKKVGEECSYAMSLTPVFECCDRNTRCVNYDHEVTNKDGTKEWKSACRVWIFPDYDNKS